MQVKSHASRRADDQRKSIGEAILELLRQGGHAAVTTDAVAQMASVSKATIYKMWSSKSELLIHAASLVLVSPPSVDRGSFRDEIEQLLRERAQQYNGELGGYLFAALLGATAQDEDFRAAFAAWVAGQMEANSDAVRRGIARGEVRTDCDPGAISTLVAGPLIYRMVVERGPVDDALIQMVVDSIVAAAAPR